ncbi:MAG: ABC transporter permease subunit [Actinomycetota bacterium]
MAVAEADVSGRARARSSRPEKPPGGSRPWAALGFMLPALALLGALIVYPVFDTVLQSLQDPVNRSFVGFDNYSRALSRDNTITALKNTLIWVVLVPGLITGGGLIFAVLTERVRYGTVIKVILFMPMAISALSVGVIWRVMYEQAPDRGLLNAVIGAGTDALAGAGAYPNATVSADQPLEQSNAGVTSNQAVAPGESVTFGLVAITDAELPPEAEQAATPEAAEGVITAVVWRDFQPGGGTAGEIEEGESGLPNVAVELVDESGGLVASETTAADGSVTFDDPGEGPFTARVAASTFDEGFQGFSWLAPALVTPSIIGAFLWAGVGFAVIVIGAGLAALPRDLLEAARTDGATEWQVFRFVTFPLMAPILSVVFITMTINVLKIFDIVYVTAPGASINAASVVALDMWRTSFQARQFGVGAAIAVLLFLMVIPIMWLNLRRFRREQS